MDRPAHTTKTIAPTTWINILIIAAFTVFFLLKGNYEFLFYAVTLGIAVYMIHRTDRVFHYSLTAQAGFNLWLLLHFSGGTFYIGGTKLYDLILVPVLGEPFNILKYDQVIHAYCYLVITLFMVSVVMHIADKNANRFLIGLITVLAGSSIGAVNEMIEFSTVVFLDAGDAVGGYYNNALDLVCNFIGATIAAIITVRGKQNAASVIEKAA